MPRRHSKVSVSSSQYRRHRKRTAILHRIVYLKRRCIRCYLINTLFSIILLGMTANLMLNYFSLIYDQKDMLLILCIFLLSTVLTLIGSVICICAMTKSLRKLPFSFGKILLTIGLILAVCAVIGRFIFVQKKITLYGYPVDIIRDCDKYSDNEFAVIVSPESRKGEQILEADKEEEEYQVDIDQDQASAENPSTSTTETIITELYKCEDLSSNVMRFNIFYCFVAVFIIATFTTLIISYVGICQLCRINSKTRKFPILPVTLVEPYEMYDEFLRRSRSNTSLATQVIRKSLHGKCWQKKSPNRLKSTRSSASFTDA